MKTSIKAQIIDINPIELLREKHGLSQKEFAAALGYTNVHNYQYHCKKFSPDVIGKITEIYGVDIQSDVISHLLHKTGKGEGPSHKVKRPSDTSFSSMVG
ncbi:MAG: helix-turn-helix transcriptional regulator [Sphaerochaetaceae bacterium]|nr:helix-turn-helix transcriptional regulator [Sphaerochaetaceae bacterium]